MWFPPWSLSSSTKFKNDTLFAFSARVTSSDLYGLDLLSFSQVPTETLSFQQQCLTVIKLTQLPPDTRWYLGDHLRLVRTQAHGCEDHIQEKACFGQVSVNFPENMATREKKIKKEDKGQSTHVHHSGRTVKASGAQRCVSTQVQIPHLKVLLKYSLPWRRRCTNPCQSSRQCQSQLVLQPW